MNTLGMIAIVIDDYDAAISHYVDDLGFDLLGTSGFSMTMLGKLKYTNINILLNCIS
jgi:hypothetical protein